MSAFRPGQPVRVLLNAVSRPGEVVCMIDDATVRVRIASISRDYPADLVSALRAAPSGDRWAELHGVRG